MADADYIPYPESLRHWQTAFVAAVEDPSDARHAIYRRNLRGGCVQALAASLPASFARYPALLRRWAHNHWPTHPNLNLYGEELFTWLDEVDAPEPLRALAQLEWAKHHSYYAPDIAPVCLQAFAALSPEAQAHSQWQLTPHCSALITSSQPSPFNSNPHWLAEQQAPFGWVFSRAAGAVRCLRTSARLVALLQSLSGPQSLQQLADALAAAGIDPTEFFTHSVRQQWLSVRYLHE